MAIERVSSGIQVVQHYPVELTEGDKARIRDLIEQGDEDATQSVCKVFTRLNEVHRGEPTDFAQALQDVDIARLLIFYSVMDEDSLNEAILLIVNRLDLSATVNILNNQGDNPLVDQAYDYAEEYLTEKVDEYIDRAIDFEANN